MENHSIPPHDGGGYKYHSKFSFVRVFFLKILLDYVTVTSLLLTLCSCSSMMKTDSWTTVSAEWWNMSFCRVQTVALLWNVGAGPSSGILPLRLISLVLIQSASQKCNKSDSVPAQHRSLLTRSSLDTAACCLLWDFGTGDGAVTAYIC